MASELSRPILDLLAAERPAYAGAAVEEIRTLSGGISRDSYRAAIRRVDGVSEDLIVQVEPASGSAIGCVDREQEWALLVHLFERGEIRVPEGIAFDGGRFVGSPTMVTRAVDGPTLAQLARDSSAADQQALALRLADVAAAVHRARVAELPDRVARPASWSEYMDSQIQEWADTERRYPGSDPFMRYVGAWLGANRPPEAPLSLLHGDLQSPNVLIPDDGAYVLADWELAHVGDPREDLGWFRLTAATTPPDLIGVDEEGFLERYRELTGFSREVVNPATIAYFTVLASLRVFAGIQARSLKLADGPQPIELAYTVLVQSFIHGVWMNSITGFEAEVPE